MLIPRMQLKNRGKEGKYEYVAFFLCSIIILILIIFALATRKYQKSDHRVIVFSKKGSVGRLADIIIINVTNAGCFEITAVGGNGGDFTYVNRSEGSEKNMTWKGGSGAYVKSEMQLDAGLLYIVIGNNGVDGFAINLSKESGKSLGNSGGGGGGGSFVYSDCKRKLYVAAGGGGGAGLLNNGVSGQNSTYGSASIGENRRNGGTNGGPGEENNSLYHAGVGAGWLGSWINVTGFWNGAPGGSKMEAWLGGRAGGYSTDDGEIRIGVDGGFGGGGAGGVSFGGGGGGGGFSGGGASSGGKSAGGGGGGSYCTHYAEHCEKRSASNRSKFGRVTIIYLKDKCK